VFGYRLGDLFLSSVDSLGRLRVELVGVLPLFIELPLRRVLGHSEPAGIKRAGAYDSLLGGATDTTP
jgi:hypothetical protein